MVLDFTTTPQTEQQKTVFLDRYALKDLDGQPIESDPSQMWDRVAEGIGTNATEKTAFRKILDGYRFVPGGRILSGAGTDTEVTFYNCYVIPLETKARRENRPNDPGSDSRESILDTISVMVDIMSRGGGVGINWSVLRPKGTHLSRVNGTTSGPVSWMDVASHAVQTVTQGGSRRGAAMFMLDDWHPDVLEFVNAKRDLTKITGANVSVAVSDEFMAAVRENDKWDLKFPDTKDEHYNTEWDGDLAGWIEKKYAVVVHQTIYARDLWRLLAQAAWDNGEPGVVFLGRYNNLSTAKGIERIISVNPCGEQGLGAYSVCNLGSLNLDAYIVENEVRTKHTARREFDWARFIADVETSVTFLDNVIDKNFYFLPENEKAQKELRRIGLGAMGMADAMIALGLRYGSPESIKFVERVYSVMKVAAIRQSCTLAQQKGAAPAWDKKQSWKSPYFADIIDTPLGGQVRRYGLRNMFLLTQAPTGSTSIIAGVNSGIEPYFAFEYTRKDRTGVHKVFAPAVTKYHADASTRMPDHFVTSEDVSVEEHIAVQAAAQKYIDSSVSKTINAPNSHTVEDVEKAFTLAYDSGLKGLAYFRDGNGRDQVLYKEEPAAAPLSFEPDEDDDLWEQFGQFTSLVSHFAEYTRPDVLDGTTTKVATRAGAAYVTVNRDPSGGRPVEVFFNVGKAGSEVAAMAEGLGRLASLALRSGATLGGVANQLEGVGGTSQFNRSICHAIGQALTTENARPVSAAADPGEVLDTTPPQAESILTITAPPSVTTTTTTTTTAAAARFDFCPECHNASLSYQEGCSKCALCGYSAC